MLGCFPKGTESEKIYKIAWDDFRVAAVELANYKELLDLKTVLMPRQWFLMKLDPRGDLSVPELRALLEPHVHAYRNLVLQDIVDPGMNVKKAMNIYKKFHFLSCMPTWGAVPFSCSCAVCFPNGVCEDTILFTALFDPEVRVPEKWVTVTVSRRMV